MNHLAIFFTSPHLPGTITRCTGILACIGDNVFINFSHRSRRTLRLFHFFETIYKSRWSRWSPQVSYEKLLSDTTIGSISKKLNTSWVRRQLIGSPACTDPRRGILWGQKSCRNYTGGFSSWPPATCRFSTTLYIKLMKPDLCKQLQFVRTLSLFANQYDLNVVFSWEL